MYKRVCIIGMMFFIVAVFMGVNNKHCARSQFFSDPKQIHPRCHCVDDLCWQGSISCWDAFNWYKTTNKGKEKRDKAMCFDAYKNIPGVGWW